MHVLVSVPFVTVRVYVVVAASNAVAQLPPLEATKDVHVPPAGEKVAVVAGPFFTVHKRFVV